LAADQANKFLPILNYYLDGTGNLTAVIKTALGVVITQIQEDLQSTAANLLNVRLQARTLACWIMSCCA
jgi:hypothetical protein